MAKAKDSGDTESSRHSGFVDPDEIIGAILEVRDPTLDAEDYSFLEENVHPAPSKKGDDGLANWIADLAVYEVDGETVVDEDLVEEVDRTLSEEHGNERTRFRNIVYDSDNRPGSKESLADNGVNGHERLLEMVKDFYNATGQEEKAAEADSIKDSPLWNNNAYGTSTQNPSKNSKGGEKMDLADELETLELAQGDHYDAVERMDEALEEYEDEAEAARSVAEEFAKVYDLQGEAAETATSALTDYLLDHREHMDDKTVELLEHAEEIRETLDDIDTPNYDDVVDAIHVAARIERKVDQKYGFNF